MYHSYNDYCTNIIVFIDRGESSDERCAMDTSNVSFETLHGYIISIRVSRAMFTSQLLLSELLGGFHGLTINQTEEKKLVGSQPREVSTDGLYEARGAYESWAD